MASAKTARSERMRVREYEVSYILVSPRTGREVPVAVRIRELLSQDAWRTARNMAEYQGYGKPGSLDVICVWEKL